MYDELKGKKLLVLGSAEVDANIVREAKELGVYVIVADGNPKSPATFAKNIADESWDIDYTKTEEIGEKCKAIGVDGVLAGYSEFRVSAACKIAGYIGSPFYATYDQIELTRNKRRFKDECKKFGVTVPKDYYLAEDDYLDTDAIRFPVIVKPTDAAGRKGITICQDQTQLERAIDLALEHSASKTVIVEEYIIGMEFVAIYALQDGRCSLACFNEKYLNQECRHSGLCDLALTPSKYLVQYLNQADTHVKAFLNGIGAKNGVAFFQGIVSQNDVYIFEMGYRLNGGNDYFITERESGVSYMKMLIAHSLTGHMIGDLRRYDPHFTRYYANFLIYAHAGKVGRIEFSGDMQKEGLGDVHIKQSPGTIIRGDGTTGQGAFSFKLISNSIPELIDLIKYCQDHAIIEDENGIDMMFAPFETDVLLQNRGD